MTIAPAHDMSLAQFKGLLDQLAVLLVSLENFQQWLEGEYRKLQAVNHDLLTYEQIVRNSIPG